MPLAPTPAAAFLQFVAARHEILQCNKRLSAEASVFATLSGACCSAIMKQMAHSPLKNDEDLAAFMTVIVEGPMLEPDKKQVIDACSQQATPLGTVAIQTRRCSPQQHQHFANYLSERDWQVFESGSPPVQKLSHCVSRCISIGLLHPSEKTASTIIAVLMCAGEDMN